MPGPRSCPRKKDEASSRYSGSPRSSAPGRKGLPDPVGGAILVLWGARERPPGKGPSVPSIRRSPTPFHGQPPHRSSSRHGRAAPMMPIPGMSAVAGVLEGQRNHVEALGEDLEVPWQEWDRLDQRIGSVEATIALLPTTRLRLGPLGAAPSPAGRARGEGGGRGAMDGHDLETPVPGRPRGTPLPSGWSLDGHRPPNRGQGHGGTGSRSWVSCPEILRPPEGVASIPQRKRSSTRHRAFRTRRTQRRTPGDNRRRRFSKRRAFRIAGSVTSCLSR
jgi:hypothetical protein